MLDEEKARDFFVEGFIRSHEKPPREITLDLDANRNNPPAEPPAGPIFRTATARRTAFTAKSAKCAKHGDGITRWTSCRSPGLVVLGVLGVLVVRVSTRAGSVT